jgi:hypothetical protein
MLQVCDLTIKPPMLLRLYNLLPMILSKWKFQFDYTISYTGLWRWYINITITILNIIHLPIFYLKQNVSETELSLRLQVEPTQLCPIYRNILCLRKHSLCFKLKTRRRLISGIVIVILIDRCHNYCARSGDVICFQWGTDKPIDLINIPLFQTSTPTLLQM